MSVSVTNFDLVANRAATTIQNRALKDLNNGTLFSHQELTCILLGYRDSVNEPTKRSYMVVASGFIGEISDDTIVDLLVGNLTTFPIYEEVIPMHYLSRSTP